MAALNFPTNPTDGQFYPDPPQPGAVLYVWSDAKGAWLTVNLGVQRVTGQDPIFITGSQQIPQVNVKAASDIQSGVISAEDYQGLQKAVNGVFSITNGGGLRVTPENGKGDVELTLLPPSPSNLGGVFAGLGVSISPIGQLSLTPASSIEIGGVKVGNGLSVTPDGVLSTSSSGVILLRDISPGFNGTNTAFNLNRLDGTPYFPASPSSLLIFVGGVLQIPGTAFGILGSQIVFTGPPQVGTTFYGLALT